MLTNNSTLFFKEVEMVMDGEIIILAYKLQTPENIGSIIRLAGNIGARKVIFLNPGQTYKDFKIKRIAGRAHEIIDWQIVNSEDPHDFIPTDFELVALETYTKATNLHSTALPRKMALLVGSENSGIPIELLEKCSQVVYIGLNGPVQSMNVSQATSVAVFEWVRQYQSTKKRV